MIVKGFTITRGSVHATHLLRTDQNEHVRIHEIRGFVASDLHGAFKESTAIARGTRCKEHLFSCAFSPPKSANLSAAEFLRGIDKTEQALGLQGQPRVIVFHEKEGSTHAHCVWSRIDAETMKAKQLSHWKVKLSGVSRELYREFGFEIPRGLQNPEERSKQSFSQAESQLAKRRGEDPREIRSIVQDCWAKSDNRKSFEHALKLHSVLLAKGDRRGLVVVDHHGDVHALSRLLGIKAKDLRSKLGESNEQTRSVEAAKKQVAEAIVGSTRERIDSSRKRFAKHEAILKSARAEATLRHRAERAACAERQDREWKAGTFERQARMPKGIFNAAWSWITGETARLRKQSETEARAQKERHTREREDAEKRQRDEQRLLAERLTELRKAQAHELLRLRREISPMLTSRDRSGSSREGLSTHFNLKLDRN